MPRAPAAPLMFCALVAIPLLYCPLSALSAPSAGSSALGHMLLSSDLAPHPPLLLQGTNSNNLKRSRDDAQIVGDRGEGAEESQVCEEDSGSGTSSGSLLDQIVGRSSSFRDPKAALYRPQITYRHPSDIELALHCGFPEPLALQCTICEKHVSKAWFVIPQDRNSEDREKYIDYEVCHPKEAAFELVQDSYKEIFHLGCLSTYVRQTWECNLKRSSGNGIKLSGPVLPTSFSNGTPWTGMIRYSFSCFVGSVLSTIILFTEMDFLFEQSLPVNFYLWIVFSLMVATT